MIVRCDDQPSGSYSGLWTLGDEVHPEDSRFGVDVAWVHSGTLVPINEEAKIMASEMPKHTELYLSVQGEVITDLLITEAAKGEE